MEKVGLRQRIANAISMALVAGTSFFLLVYVGYGEANRSYEQFYVEKLTAQAKVLVNGIESFLHRDLPLDQYVGFAPRASRLLTSDPTVAAIAVFDQDHRLVFSSGEGQRTLIAEHKQVLKALIDDQVVVQRDETYLHVMLPLANDRQNIGRLAISMHHDVISTQVELQFAFLLPLAAGLPVVFGLFVGGCSGWLQRQRPPILQFVYAGLFILMSVLVVATLVTLYTKGTQIKTKALADSLGQRMTEVVGFNLDIEQIPGLDQAFSEYRRLNPDIAAAALVVDDTILIHTDSYMVGRPWKSTKGHYEYLVDISPPNSDRRVNIAVILPQEIVYWRTVRSVKNFAALFVASAFLASLFLQLAGSVRRQDCSSGRGSPPPDQADLILKLVKPVFYVTMCVEHLSYAFLANYIESLVQAAGLPMSLTSTAFTVYYLCFALALIPAGHIAQQLSPKPLMVIGLFLSALSFLLMLSPENVSLLILARAGAGIGQALIFIGVQSYILAVASPDKKTQGAAIIVYGFQGGMISGMAIGSLLVSYIGPAGVFAIAAVATILTLTYAVFMVPAISPKKRNDAIGFGASVTSLSQHMIEAIRHPQLLQAITLIGIPAKAVLTGVVVFALPLLMAQHGYRQEDIGQLLMLYAAGVVFANSIVSKWVDRTGDARFVLIGGGVLSGLGLGLIAVLGWSGFEDIAYGVAIEIAMIVTGILLLGCAHGMINAPIVSHVAGLDLGENMGVSALTATYRFLERIGHVAGPLIVGQIFIFGGQNAFAIAWIGLAVSLFAILFYGMNKRFRSRSKPLTAPMNMMAGEVDYILGLHLDPPQQALVLAITPNSQIANADLAQNVMFSHLLAHGRREDVASLREEAGRGYEAWPNHVSSIVQERRRANRLKAFLNHVAIETSSDQHLLVIIGSQHMQLCAGDIAEWLGQQDNVTLVVMTSAGAWLDQLRGWITLLNLDSMLGNECLELSEMMADLQQYFGAMDMPSLSTCPPASSIETIRAAS